MRCSNCMHPKWLHLPCSGMIASVVGRVNANLHCFHKPPYFPLMPYAARWIFPSLIELAAHSATPLTMTPSGTSQTIFSPTQFVLLFPLNAIFFALLSIYFRFLVCFWRVIAQTTQRTNTHSRGWLRIVEMIARTLCMQSIGCGFNWICTVLFFAFFLSLHTSNTSNTLLVVKFFIYFFHLCCAVTANLRH